MLNIVISYLICSLGSFIVFMFYDSFLTRKENIRPWIYPLGILVLSVALMTCNTIFSGSLTNNILMIICEFGGSFLFKGLLKVKIAIASFNVLLSFIMESLVLFLIMTIGGFSAEEAVGSQTLWILGVMLSKLSYLTVAYLICLWNKRRIRRLDGKTALLFMIALVGSVVNLFILCEFQYNSYLEYMNIWTVVGSVLILLSFFSMLYLFTHLSEQSEKITEQRLMEQQLNSRIKYYNDMIATETELRKLRHDLKNHLILLRRDFEEGNNIQGINYIDGLADRLHLSGDGAKTGNGNIDAIVSVKKKEAEGKGITFEWDMAAPNKIKAEPADLCIILGNALDNAIEACEKINNGKRNINIEMFYKNGMLSCTITNSVNDKEFSMTSRKGDAKNHGIGLNSIRSAVEKYSGILNTEYSKGFFTLSFVIPC